MSISLSAYGERKFAVNLQTSQGHSNVTWYRFSSKYGEEVLRDFETLFELTYIPEGFVLVEHLVCPRGATQIIHIYENAKGEEICFEQALLSHGRGFNKDQWDVDILQIRDLDVVYGTQLKKKVLFWGNYGYSFSISVYGSFSQEECLKMLESVEKIKE